MKKKNKTRRRSRKKVSKAINTEDFLKSSTLIKYNLAQAEIVTLENIESVKLDEGNGTIQWLNCIGNDNFLIYKNIINQNGLDDFLIVLLDIATQRNKLVELDNCFFFSLQSVNEKGKDAIELETINFVVSPHFVWSIQEFAGDPFDNIRQRILGNQGIVRSKKCDYLVFIIVEAIIDNYFSAYEELAAGLDVLINKKLNGRDINVLKSLENKRKIFFQIKKAAAGLKESVSHINTLDLAIFDGFNDKYFFELKEQSSSLIDSVDNELQRIESAINLFFSLQSSRLNEIMKTLTILTVVFIPLSFVTGFYGMNFENMPGLKSHNGFYIAISTMFTLVLVILYYFKRRNWF